MVRWCQCTTTMTVSGPLKCSISSGIRTQKFVAPQVGHEQHLAHEPHGFLRWGMGGVLPLNSQKTVIEISYFGVALLCFDKTWGGGFMGFPEAIIILWKQLQQKEQCVPSKK